MNWAMPLAPRGLKLAGHNGFLSKSAAQKMLREDLAQSPLERAYRTTDPWTWSSRQPQDCSRSNFVGLQLWRQQMSPRQKTAAARNLSELLSPAVQSPLTAASSHPATKHGPRSLLFPNNNAQKSSLLSHRAFFGAERLKRHPSRPRFG